MITKTNQTSKYKNEVIRDAITLIRKGESAFVYSKYRIHNIDMESNVVYLSVFRKLLKPYKNV